MKSMISRTILGIALSLGVIVGLFKGPEARQKWVFRIKSRMDEKKQIADQKKQVRGGAVLLDDIEIAAFHRS
jgi:hypothetical protein